VCRTKVLVVTIIGSSWLVGSLQARPVDGALPVVKMPPVKTEPADMVTDRPDFTESTSVVGKGVVQIENGFTVERNPHGSNLSGPELLMRVGLSHFLEWRIGGDGFLSERTSEGERYAGFSDLEVGVKLRLLEQGRYRPALSLIPIVSIPLGTSRFSSGDYDPTLKVALGKHLAKNFSLGANVNFSSLTAPEGRFLQTAWSASLSHELGRGFGGYWEAFGFTPWEKGGSTAWIANTGITRSLGRNAQIDVRVGKRLTDSGPGWFWGMGVAVRQQGWPFSH
jgi:hypothetical protein